MTDDVCSEGAATGGVALRVHAGEPSRVATEWGLGDAGMGVRRDPATPAAGSPWADAAYGNGTHIASARLDDGDDDDYDDDEDDEDDDLLDDDEDEDDLLDDDEDEDEDDDV